MFARPSYFVVFDDVTAEAPGLEWNYHSCAPIRDVNLTTGQIHLEGRTGAMILAVGSPTPLTAATGKYATDGTVLTHNLVLTQVQPQRTLQLAAILAPYRLDAVTPKPAVHVENRPDAIVFTVEHAEGTDRVVCRLARDGEPAIRITRTHDGIREELFTSPAHEPA